MSKKIIFLLMFLFIFVNSYSYNISNCNDDPNASGLWVLNQSIDIGTGSCLIVASNNMVIDCQGYLINSTDNTQTTYGIDTNNFDNITIQNCNVQNFGNGGNEGGIFLNSDHSSILNTNLSFNYDGLFIGSSSNNSFVNIYSFNNSDDGIEDNSGGEGDYNNIISNYNGDNGFVANYMSNSIVRNLQTNYNTDNGIQLAWTTARIQFIDFESKFNGGRGVHIIRVSNGNTFLRGDIRDNTNENLYFGLDGASNYPYNNSFSQVYLGNYSKIGSDYNFTNSSSYNVLYGNYFDDFVSNPYCYSSGPWSFCDNSASLGPSQNQQTLSSIFPSISLVSFILFFISYLLL